MPRISHCLRSLLLSYPHLSPGQPIEEPMTTTSHLVYIILPLLFSFAGCYQYSLKGEVRQQCDLVQCI